MQSIPYSVCTRFVALGRILSFLHPIYIFLYSVQCTAHSPGFVVFHWACPRLKLPHFVVWYWGEVSALHSQLLYSTTIHMDAIERSTRTRRRWGLSRGPRAGMPLHQHRAREFESDRNRGSSFSNGDKDVYCRKVLVVLSTTIR
jgi:hypothetical protein